MATRTYRPIDKDFDGTQKDNRQAVERLKKERYANPIYEIGQITDFVYRSEDPLEKGDLERKIIVQGYSYDKSLKTGIGPKKEQERHEDETSYIIGVRRGQSLDKVLKIGDIVEIQIVSNELTKRNNIDGFYSSTLKETDGVWNFIEGSTFDLTDSYKGIKNDLSKNFFPSESETQTELSEEVLATKRVAPSYRRGNLVGNIEIITLEGKEVEVNTAKQYLAMKKEARKDGIYLGITSGYRTMESQTKIYNRRYEPDYQGTGTCTNKGENTSGTFEKAIREPGVKVAAYPGCSNHQNGKALDLWNSPANVRWLRANAARFGFFNTVASENHHWEYLG
jgi:hypothetical protein